MDSLKQALIDLLKKQEEQSKDLFHTDDEADNEINKELYDKEMSKD